MRLQQSMGDLSHNRLVTTRTDINVPVLYRQNKHVLFGQQEGRCNGCRSAFPIRNFTIDHIIPENRGGTDRHRKPSAVVRALQQRQGRPAAGVPGG